MNARYSKKIENLYLQMYFRLFAYARSLLDNDALAEEAVQDTFHIACQKADELCGCDNPEGWLFSTTKYVVSNMIRTRDNAKRLLMDYLSMNVVDITILSDRINLEVLYDDIADTDEFQMMKEMALEGRSHLEMAQKRGITINTCRKRLERAKKFLQKKIK